MSIPFNKKYKLDRSENFDEFLKELGKSEKETFARCVIFFIAKISIKVFDKNTKIMTLNVAEKQQTSVFLSL